MDFRQVKCKNRCIAVESCVFYQYEADTCYLCIHDAADAAAENHLTSSTAPAQAARTHVKQDIADVIFTSTQPCHGPLLTPGALDPNFYRISTGSLITRLRFCGYGGFSDVVGGFYATFDGIEQQVAGCNFSPGDEYLTNDNYPEFLLMDHEVVLNVEVCYAMLHGHNVLNTLTLHTNLRQFGPHGTLHGGSCERYALAGYGLMGLYGWAGHAMNSLGPVFSRCSSP